MEYEAVFFDMDGVIVDTASDWQTVEREHILPQITAEPIPQGVIRARSVVDIYDHLSGADEYTVTVTREEFLALYDRWAQEIYEERAQLLEGFWDLLDSLRTTGTAIGLVSASPGHWVEMVLERFRLGDEFDVVVAADDIDGPSKPDPAPYLEALTVVDTDPLSSIAIEDSRHGVEAAFRAGMYTIGLRGAGNRTTDLSRADVVVDNPTALRDELADRLWN